MSIKKNGITSWTHEFEGQYCNREENEITATLDGISIDGDTIPWAEIDAARDSLIKDEDSIPAEMLRQRQEAMGLRREIILHKLLENKSTKT